MLSTLLSEGKIQDMTRRALLLPFKAVLEKVFICLALGLKSGASDAPHPLQPLWLLSEPDNDWILKNPSLLPTPLNENSVFL